MKTCIIRGSNFHAVYCCMFLVVCLFVCFLFVLLVCLFGCLFVLCMLLCDQFWNKCIVNFDCVKDEYILMPVTNFCHFIFQYKEAYQHYMITIALMLGANKTIAIRDMTDVLEFETRLANVSTINR